MAIHGPAGVESAVASAVAQALADLYPDGQLFVDLRGAAAGAGQATVAASSAPICRCRLRSGEDRAPAVT